MKGDLPGELIFRWFALRAMKTLSIFAFALFLPAVVTAQSNQNAIEAYAVLWIQAQLHAACQSGSRR